MDPGNGNGENAEGNGRTLEDLQAVMAAQIEVARDLIQRIDDWMKGESDESDGKPVEGK